MRFLTLLVATGLATTANAQFSVSGAGDFIPNQGTGGDAAAVGDAGAVWDTTQAGFPGSSTVSVPEAVTSIDCVTVHGLSHTWIGDLQATLVDPAGNEHLIFVRPGYLNTGTFGNSGDFLGGDYTFVESGGMDLPDQSSTSTSPAAGCYNQTFSTGGTTWVSGTNNISNTPLSGISGAAGDWQLHIYDWAGGDTGQFTGWTLSGNGAGDCAGCGASDNTGKSDCDCTGANGPCSTASGAGRGCPNSNANGLGAMLVGSGNASIGADTFSLALTDGPPSKPGLILSGTASLGPNGVGTVPDSAGILCVGGATRRGSVVMTDASGAASFPDFQGAAYSLSDIVTAGGSVSYTYWGRDPNTAAGCAGDTASSDFTFSNGWTVNW
jgi:subtilisin-like proprotein convertase family protein